jgi:pentose-5-phosphate-3-epimerase
MEYSRTKDILCVKELLGHVNINNTLVYTHLVNFGSEEFVCKVAENVEEAKALIESGYEYITEMDGIKLFRKRK